MRSFLVLLIAALVFGESVAQDGYGSTSVYDRVVQLPAGKHLFIAPPAREWNETPWKDSVYRFESFQRGKLEMTNGFVPSHRPMLNYSVMMEAMAMKPDSGNIVAMRKSPAIKCVWIGDHKFVNDRMYGFLEIILDGKICVGQKIFMNGIYELSNGTKYPIRAINDMTSTGYIKVPMKQSTRYYWVEEQYFMLGENMKTFRCSSRALAQLLPKQKKAIKAFSKSNHINYRRKEDVLKVVGYANEQPATNGSN
jgi:hypothetical protein